MWHKNERLRILYIAHNHDNYSRYIALFQSYISLDQAIKQIHDYT